MAACMSQDCAQAFIRSSTLSGGTLAGNKRAQSLQSKSEWSGKKKSMWKELITTLCFFNAPSLSFPTPHAFHSHFHHFPLDSDKEELALVPPFLHTFQSYPSTSFSPPVPVWRSASLHPSIFVSSSSLFLPPFLFHLDLSVFIPLFIPTRLGHHAPCHRSEEDSSLSSWFDKILAVFTF